MNNLVKTNLANNNKDNRKNKNKEKVKDLKVSGVDQINILTNSETLNNMVRKRKMMNKIEKDENTENRMKKVGNKKISKFSKISKNLFIYLSEFLSLTDYFQILNLNINFRTVLKKNFNNYMNLFKKLVEILEKEKIKDINDFLRNDEKFLETKILTKNLNFKFNETQVLRILKYAILYLTKKCIKKNIPDFLDYCELNVISSIRVTSHIRGLIKNYLPKIFVSSEIELLPECFKISKTVNLMITSIDFKKLVDIPAFLNFLNYFDKNNHISEIDVYNCRIKDQDSIILSELFKNKEYLSNLKFSHNSISDEDYYNLLKFLYTNRNLKKIEVSDNLGIRGAKALGAAIQTNSGLIEINLWNNNLKDEGTRIITTALKTLYNYKDNRNNGRIENSECSLKELHLGANMIGDEGAIAIADFMKNNNSISFLNLGRNLIRVKGAEALAEALKLHNTIYKISLSNNKISDDGAKAIAEALKVNNSLKEVYVRDNNLSADGKIILRKALDNREIEKGEPLQIFLDPEYHYQNYFDYQISKIFK